MLYSALPTSSSSSSSLSRVVRRIQSAEECLQECIEHREGDGCSAFDFETEKLRCRLFLAREEHLPPLASARDVSGAGISMDMKCHGKLFWTTAARRGIVSWLSLTVWLIVVISV